MALEVKDILIKNDFVIDGKKSLIASNELFYIGHISAAYDIVIYGEALDVAIPLNFNGVVKKIIITNESCGDLEYKLNNSSEKYLLRNQLILSQQPTALKIDNVEDVNKIIRVRIIGEES